MSTSNGLSISVALMGHVDSGKTSLARSLSQILSTAALDKSPQSTERGITLDIGFSSFSVTGDDVPKHIKDKGYDAINYTIVDCPGHSSLIRTVLGGAAIMDMAVLVVDAQKGFQAQTAECVVVAEITTSKLVVALNKCDLFPKETRQKDIEKITKTVKRILSQTKFKESPIVTVSALSTSEETDPLLNINNLKSAIVQQTIIFPRFPTYPLLFLYDHCFSLKGKGTVLTGRILSGTLSINDNILLPSLHSSFKVKSIQVFHSSFSSVSSGERVGVCVNGLDADKVERGLACGNNNNEVMIVSDVIASYNNSFLFFYLFYIYIYIFII